MAQAYAAELAAALEAIRAAAGICQSVQRRLVSPETLKKKDRSPVTVADFASQAVVCAKLAQAFPQDGVVGEEDSAELREPAQAAILQAVVEQARTVLTGASEAQVLAAIDRGGADGQAKRFWTLDPIDGTKGFLRGEQYAVALALIVDGKIVLGATAGPNLKLAGRPETGVVAYAVRGQGAWVAPLAGGTATPLRVSPITDPSLAVRCESVESEHSDQGGAAIVAQTLKLTAAPVRLDSLCKYVMVASGDATVYLRMPTDAKRREKIWDHAAGAIVVEEAGGKVTDVDGKPLDFGRGRELLDNRGIIATNGHIHGPVAMAVGKALAGK